MLEENRECWLINNCNHKDCDCFCKRRFKLNYYYEQAMIPLQKRVHMTFRVDKEFNDSKAFTYLSTIEKDIVNFVKSGKNLYIHSRNTGNGKTSWALRLVEAYLHNIWFKSKLECKVLFISVPRYLIELKNNINTPNEYITHIKENVLNADLVIWDDIADKSASAYDMTNLLSIIDYRINNNLSNIFTTNLNEDELHQALGDRLSSRIINTSVNIELVGLDKRNLK